MSISAPAGGRPWSAGTIALYVVLSALGVVMIFPFLWMIATSFKHPSDIYTLSLLPSQPTLDNYVLALTRYPFARWFGNSVLVASVTTLSVAFFDSLAGYVLAKLEFPFKSIIFVLILCTLMVPTEMLVIPWYIMSVDYHWTDTYWGIMFPGVISAFGVFLMRQFMHSVPNELLDAGRIDGLGEFGLFWRVALPLVRPSLAALCILTFLGNWNAFLWPLIVIQAPLIRTLPVGLSQFSYGEAGSRWELIMTGASIATIPVLVVFAVFQRHIIRGVALTGLK
ncbi:MAG: carbohydrate ABC transporter permease [Chloroflexota bacterium]|nr:carbohydrate ABC transporter permease [Chloroflexota bacterium]